MKAQVCDSLSEFHAYSVVIFVQTTAMLLTTYILLTTNTV